MKKTKKVIYFLTTALAVGSIIFGWMITAPIFKVSAANHLSMGKYKNAMVEVKVGKDLAMNAEELKEMVEGALKEQRIKITDTDEGEKTAKIFVSFFTEDGDLDDDGIPNSKDPDDDGNGLDDAEEEAKAKANGVFIEGDPVPADDVEGNQNLNFVRGFHSALSHDTGKAAIGFGAMSISDIESSLINAKRQPLPTIGFKPYVKPRVEQLTKQVDVESKFELEDDDPNID